MAEFNLSLILCTIRPEPKFDWMADSLWNAMVGWTDGIEIIVVDGQLWYQQDRREQLADAVAGRFNYRHVEPKPSPWQGPHRKTSRDYFDLCGARNTGIAYSQHDHCVLFDDNSLLDRAFISCHRAAAKHGVALCGGFETYSRASILNGEVIDGEKHPSQDTRGDEIKIAPGGWMYGLNISFPKHYAIICNGYDELYSGQGGSEDCDFGVRIQRAGCKIVYNPECKIYQILETHTDVMDWSLEAKAQRRMKERVLRDGIPHFANEYLIQKLMDEPNRHLPLGNDFFLSDLMRKAANNEPFPISRSISTDWRDGQPLAEM